MTWFSRNKKQSFNCHFCNKNTTTPKIYKQGWICPDPFCCQYNGFKQNGDYNLNIINEFTQPSTICKKPTYCKPSNIPFKIPNNVFQSNVHFTPNTYIPSTSSAPLCDKCQQNQKIIQFNLRTFDAGANSNYKAFTQYRQLLNDKFPICNHCKSQCAYQLNTINHNARLWQKYDDSLPPTNFNAFKIETKVNDTNNYCCSSFVRCIINSLLLYVSFFISVIGLSNYCQTHLSTSFELIKKCDIQLYLLRCHDVKQTYWTPCLYVHSLKNEMSKYFLVSNYMILSGILLLFTFITYNDKRHKYKWYILLVLSCTLLILIPIIDGLFANIPFSGGIINLLQIGMPIFCLLFLICTKYDNNGNTNRNFNNKQPKMYPTPKKMDSRELLNLLEEQEVKENINTKAMSKPVENNTAKQPMFTMTRSNSASASVEQKNEEHTPFFPSFGGKDSSNRNNNKMSEWKNVNDPFQKRNNNSDDRYNSYHTEPINRVYGNLANNNNGNNARSNRNFGSNHEPMDMDTPIHHGNVSRNINCVRDGIHSLDLNGAHFDS